MITWMQHHKKYLIVTIWVSVIAFVGAGFVGWGSLDLSSKSSLAGKVGRHDITIQAFQNSYQNYYSYLNNMNNGQLTPEDAESYGLKNIVMGNLINEALLFNFADEMGIIALDSDVVNELVTNPNFMNDRGVFDKDLYYSILRNNGMKIDDYEKSLKKQALLKKVFQIFDLPVSQKEKEAVASAFFLEDRISLSTVSVEDNELEISDNDTMNFWEMNKNMFLSEKTYEFGSVFIPASTKELSLEDIKKHYEETKYFYKDADDKILDFEAVKEKIENDLRVINAELDSKKAYLALKKNEIQIEKNIIIKESDKEYNVALFQSASADEVLNPIKKENGYEILKLVKINFPEPKSYEEAYPQVLSMLKNQKRTQLLTKKAESRLSIFAGQDIGFISKSDTQIQNLLPQESTNLIGQIFNSKDKTGYIVLNDKALLFKITDQKLPSEDVIKENSELLEQSIKQMTFKEISDGLIKQLRARYKIEQYI